MDEEAVIGARHWILETAGGGAWLVAALCALQGLAAANAVAFALLMRQCIDRAVAGDADGFALALAVFACLLALQVLLSAANRAVNERARASLENRLRRRAFGAALEREYRTASAFHTGELMSRMTSDVAVVADGAATIVPSAVSLGVRIVGALGVLFALLPALALVFVGAGLAMALASALLRGWLKRLHRRAQEAESAVRCYVQECLESLLVVHAFGCEGKVARENDRNQEAHRRARIRKGNASNGCSSGLSLVMQLGYLLGFAWCCFGILHGTVTYGTMMAVIQLVGQIQSPFASLGGTFSRYSAMLASAERLMELENGGARARELRMRPRAGADERERANAGRFEAFGLDGASFSFDGDRRVLNRCSLEVRAGEFVGMTGCSGGGKSTVARLLLGAYAPDEGSAYVRLGDGSTVACSEVAGMFAYVPQGNCLMSGTVREVVGFAERGPSVDEERMRRACEAACAGFVELLPDGYDTVLGERGSGLSEGQMQRLAVARAVYSDAPVLLLDEATSALDAATERRMLANLRALPGRTALVVTHRKETLRACTRAVELREGACEPA